MANPFNGSKRGKRGGAPDRPSRKPYVEIALAPEHRGASSVAALAVEAGSYYESFTGTETRETHVVPRRSLTRKLLLKVHSQDREYESIPQPRHLDKVALAKLEKAGNKITNPNDPRLKLIGLANPGQMARQTWASDRTLLRSNKPVNENPKLNRLNRAGRTSYNIDRDFLDPGDAESEVID